MRSRGLVVVLALILATVATAGVFLYTRGVKEDARTGGELTRVIVSKVDIPANSDLNQLISEDQFVSVEVRSDTLVEGAVTDIAQLRNRRNNVFIVQGEQIPVSRVEGAKVPGGVLSIPEGHQAITVSLASPRAVGAAMAGGDNVTVYATFNDVAVKLRGNQSTVTGNVQQTSATVVLVPQVEVLRVVIPQQNVTGDEDSQPDTTANMNVTLAFTPDEAQKFVYSLENGSVYLALLPPDAEGVELEPLTVEGIVNPPKAKGNVG